MQQIRFIGHPMIDVGVATLCTAAGVSTPTALTPEAIDEFTAQLVDLYINPAMSGFLGYVVFANARFANPAQLKPEFDTKRTAILSELVNLWKPDAAPTQYEQHATEGETCVFSGDPATVRVSRMYIPMTTDETNINFVPEGVPLMPISGWCMLALMAMPLGGLASKGKMWITHSYDHNATLYFAKRNLARNRQDFQVEGLSKRPNYKFARSYLLRDLSEALSFSHIKTRYPVTTYLFTSSGQKSDIEINHLSTSVLRFIQLAKREFPEPWQQITRRAEQLNTSPETDADKVVYTERNYFYEDLFNLPHDYLSFLRRYLLRIPLSGKPSGAAKNDPRYTYSHYGEANIISWGLTTLFLTEVLEMDKGRIEAIKVVADRVANYIQKEDERLFNTLFNARNEYEFRLALIKADKAAQPPLFTLDEFVLAFFATTDQDALQLDWRLARDLMVVRIIEKLHENGRVEIVQNVTVEDDDPVEVE